jgi:gas vesicle protein
MKFRFLKGALLGVLAGILMAPKAGRETREGIKKAYEEISDRISEELCLLKEVTQETYNQIIHSAVNAYVETKKITVKEAEQIIAQLKEGYEKVRNTHKEGVKVENKNA